MQGGYQLESIPYFKAITRKKSSAAAGDFFCKLPMEEQHRKIEENINEWMGVSHEQIDDLMVIGIRPASFSSS